MLELTLIIVCNAGILAFIIAGIISALSPRSQLEKRKLPRLDNKT